ncbi:MAG: GFA family protein [Pseudomonadota bacterium]
MLNGHCECQRIQIEVDGPIEDFSFCHCSQCRRLHGADYATFAGVKKNVFRYASGQDQISIYESSAKNDRAFCRVCGSTILVESNDEPDMVYLSMSVFDGDPARPTGYHAWVSSKAPWHEINDDLEQHDGYV